MAKDTSKHTTDEVFDVIGALGLDGGDPLPARMGEFEFSIRRRFTGAEVVAVSDAALNGKADIIAATLTEGVDPAELAGFIEGQMQDVAGRLWAVLFAKSGLTVRGE